MCLVVANLDSFLMVHARFRTRFLIDVLCTISSSCFRVLQDQAGRLREKIYISRAPATSSKLFAKSSFRNSNLLKQTHNNAYF